MTEELKEAKMLEAQQMQRRKASFLHVRCVRRPTIQKNINGIKARSSIDFAKALGIQKIQQKKKKKIKATTSIGSLEPACIAQMMKRVLIYSLQVKLQQPTTKTLLIDSRYTNHMTNNEKLFYKLDNSINVSIRMGNGATVKSQGRGTVAI